MNLKDKLRLIATNTNVTLFRMGQKDLEYITQVLELNGKSASELRNLRDEVVKHFQERIELTSLGTANMSYETFMTQLCPITHCIDMKLAEMGKLH